MRLSSYRDLIKHLPYQEQAFETSKETWKKFEGHPAFSAFYASTFTQDRAKLSRADLFELVKTNASHAILSTILWGYPRNMRGNSFDLILESLPIIKAVLKEKKEMSHEGFHAIVKKLGKTGIGLSTLSKFLYFFGFSIDGHQCLIFDSRIIDVLNDRHFEELDTLENLTAFNKTGKYLEYLQLMERIAKENGYAIDQLELFLFMFGKNLKESA
jgi:hypothetical protein